AATHSLVELGSGLWRGGKFAECDRAGEPLGVGVRIACPVAAGGRRAVGHGQRVGGRGRRVAKARRCASATRPSCHRMLALLAPPARSSFQKSTGGSTTVSICGPTPSFSLIFFSISSARSGLSLRNLRAFSLP